MIMIGSVRLAPLRPPSGRFLLLLLLLGLHANSVVCFESSSSSTTSVPSSPATSSKDYNACDEAAGNCTLNSNDFKNEPSTPYIQEITNISSTTSVPLKTTSTTTSTTQKQPNGVKENRALNFDAVNTPSNNLNNKTSSSLSDVSLDNDDENDETPMISAKILSSQSAAGKNGTSNGQCVKGGLTYENGEKLEVDCDQVCTCSNGKMDCVDRCTGPFVPKGRKIDDPLCEEAASHDRCCSILRCATDTEVEPLEICHYNNKTYDTGDIIQEGCMEICTCEPGGKLNCKPRCKPLTKTSDKCLEIPDKNDPCCKTVICDVTLKDNKLIAAKFINETTIKLEFESKLEPNQNLPLIDVSEDKNSWKTYTPLKGGYLSHLDSNVKFAKIENSDDLVEIQSQNEGDSVDKSENGLGDDLEMNSTCLYKQKVYKIGEEFSDACESFCVCKESGVKCLKMECPTFFGTDVLDPNCIKWETVPANFTPVPPKCCPDKLQCKNNGSCLYKDEMYQNWQQIPTNITGCEKRCYCEMGKVDCQNVCPPVTATPPANLECEAHEAALSHLPGDDCCMYWFCDPKTNKKGTDASHVEEVEPGVNKTTTDISPTYSYPQTTTESKLLGPVFITSNQKPGKTNAKSKNSTQTEPGGINENDTENSYLGPFNPSYKPKQSKPTKSKANNKNNDNFHPHFNDNNYHDVDHGTQMHPQHPDLNVNGYPLGPIVEIHDYPEKPSHLYPNNVPNQHPGQNIPQRFPPGISIEQILQEIHKTGPINPNHPLPPGHPGQNFPPPYLQKPPTNGRPPAQSVSGLIPAGFPLIPDYQLTNNEVNVHTLEAVDAHTVRLGFTVPQVIVGLHGRVEVKYTDKDLDDLNAWEHQVFAPPNDLIATPHLEFDLVELRANTEYKVKITITLRDLHNTPTSKIYKIRTLKELTNNPVPTMIPIEPELSITEVNATWVNVAWRKFTENEMQFIDGVQLRFKEIDGKIYAATPLIHRAVTNYTLENLKPNTKYEIGIFFIPFTGQHTELHAEHMLHFTTANEVDTYGFQVMLEITLIKATNVEISWSGVPYPEDKYVNIYRAIYQSDSGKGDSSMFKVAKRDSSPKTSITDLKPGTRYRLWLEIYLTNGKIKTSNVQDFITKPQSAPNLDASYKQDKLSGNLSDEKGDYYGSLVIVAILAAIAILSTLVLLLILVRRHGQNKACITPPTRISQSAYDNPTYKVEIQQETMDL